MLYIGTPSQEFALIVDSGSTVTYVPCATCEQCGNHQIFVRQKNRSSSKAPDNPIKRRDKDGCNPTSLLVRNEGLTVQNTRQVD
ncbi:hypothetical protein E2562_027579 [Oryza meyeriana var. granulata]|uniref:Peptidase A1 domain-containing protein n=1 Tax=Oryza meyeriana var. granulata TaxID=110450 RepID=A0A6G1DNY1_9ORYZ|nr:hypothetical protein E2562_027579 [Oryza meyeriana var. granulata]